MALNFFKDIFDNKKRNNSVEEKEENLEVEVNSEQNADKEDIKSKESVKENIEEKHIDESHANDEVDDLILNEFKLTSDTESEEDFTDALNKLLEEDSKTELTDVNYEYINDVSVYDTVRNEKEDVIQEIKENEKAKEKKESKKELSNEKTSFIMIVILIVMVILVIGACGAFFVAVNVINQREVSGDFKGEVISQNKRSVVAANYIYVDNVQPYGEKELKLIKVLVDASATVFYFDGKLDMRNADFSLIDDSGNYYALDLNSIENVYFNDNITQVYFEPLKTGVNALKLTVTGINSGNSAVFDCVFNKPVSVPMMAYLKDKAMLKEQNEDFSVKVNYLEYSGASSHIEYMIQNNDNEKFDVVQMVKNDGDYIELSEGTGTKLKIWDKPKYDTFDNDRITLGSMNFKPLDNIAGKTEIKFNNLYKRYKVDMNIPAINISQGSDDEKENVYEFDHYKAVFEGLKGYEDAYFLVFHCEDKKLKAKSADDYSNRKEILLDAQLVFNSSNGMQVTLEGTCTAENYGTDMIFPINDITSGIFKNMSREDLSVVIKNIYVKAEDMNIIVKPELLRFKKPYVRNQLEEVIKNAFNLRLDYKTGNVDKENVEGFSADVISDESLMKNYSPVSEAKDVKKSVQITALEYETMNCYAIVMETLKYEQQGKKCYFYRTHKISMKRVGNNWVIDWDKIIS